MFFCEECRNKNDWPGISPVSYGRCEVCGHAAECYDVPSRMLPLPAHHQTAVDGMTTKIDAAAARITEAINKLAARNELYHNCIKEIARYVIDNRSEFSDDAYMTLTRLLTDTLKD